jgi:hypothetical protein
MIGGSLLSVLPKGFFSWPVPMEEESRGPNSLSVVVDDDGKRRKRRRGKGDRSDPVGGSRTPTLVTQGGKFSRGDVQTAADNDDCDRPFKRLRGESKVVSVPQQSVSTPHKKEGKQQTSDFLTKVPEDVLAHCLSFLGTAEDRFALQTTCKLFRDISNSDSILTQVNIGGDIETGKNGIIQDHDTPASAAACLAPFARAGNIGALYM